MGLDAYIKSFPADTEFDKEGHRLASTKGYESAEIGYFRKVNWLHHWMQVLYANRTGITDQNDFNCVHVVLSKKDLLDLQQDIIDDNITPTPGFFFGNQEIYPEQKKAVIEVIAFALLEISEGKVVSYSSCW